MSLLCLEKTHTCTRIAVGGMEGVAFQDQPVLERRGCENNTGVQAAQKSCVKL